MTHQPITGQELSEMKQRCEKATPGPWKQDEEYPEQIYYGDEWKDGFYIVPPDDMRPDAIRVENTEFIAHARQDLPHCIAEIERLRAALLDFKTHGLRCDCNPTNGHTWDASRWQSYLQNADSHVRTRAQIALSEETQP